MTTGLVVSNTTAVVDFFRVYVDKFREMFKSRQFVHKYIQEGMDDMEFEYVKLCNLYHHITVPLAIFIEF
jgi:hypothetical protein